MLTTAVLEALPDDNSRYDETNKSDSSNDGANQSSAAGGATGSSYKEQGSELT
jgi:hypothetical protein